ncbi:MAG: DNA internalization-related competence protein ComEC/Rec2 [Betaproteobacteria bacterium]|nr:DNA internalization-related competence protein ComEC/Rec2 [Betaproteobacteria bacterium]
MRLSILAFALGVCCLQWQAALPPEPLWMLSGAVVCLALTQILRRPVNRACCASKTWILRLRVGCLRHVGWVERSETHHFSLRNSDGFRYALPILRTCLALAQIKGRTKAINAAFLALTLAAAFVAGFGWAAWRAEILLERSLPVEREVRDLIATGVVAEMPQPVDGGTRFVFALEGLEDEQGNALPEAETPARIALSWYSAMRDGVFQPPPPLAAGERWRLTVRLKRPHGSANPNGFDYEAWLLERGIRATGFVRARSVAMEAAPEGVATPAMLAQRLDGFVAVSIHSPAYAIERLRAAVRERFNTALPEGPYAGILVALVVGDQNAIPSEQWEIFARTGITHLVAISGLHVTMIAMLAGGLVSRLWRRQERLVLALPARRAAVLLGWLAAFFYTLLAGFAVPSQRTLYMLSVAACALWLGHTGKASRTLCLALLIVLLLDPWAVLAPGFWLSFGAVAALFYVSLARLGMRRAAETAEEGAKAARLGRAVFHSVSEWGLAQWSATLGTLPLLLLFFHQFSLVSPLANAVAIPSISFVITPLALVAAMLPDPLSSMLLAFDHTLLSWLMRLIETLAAWPVWRQAAPPWWTMPLALLGLVCLLLPRGVPGRLAGVILLLPVLSSPAPRPPAGTAWLTVLDVGQGLAVAVRTAEHTLLYDAGPRYGLETDAGSRVVVPWLYAEGIGRIDRLIVTHADTDHSGGVASVLAAMPVGEIFSSLDEAIGERCRAGQQWEWDGVRFSILHPDRYPGENLLPDASGKKTRQIADKPNHRSCVLRVENRTGSVLLTSDIEASDEAALLRNHPAALPADVLLVPHHGSRTSSTPAFIAAVGARDAIFPVGYRNPYRHPHPLVLARYADTRTWRSDVDGAISVVLGDEIEIAAWRRQSPRYWHGR